MSASVKLLDILLVEDNVCDVELTRHLFAAAKIKNNLHVVADGEEALDYLHHRGPHGDSPRPDMILLDLHLPRKDGYEIAEILGKDFDTKNIPVIFLTGDASGRARRHPARFLPKPLTLSSLMGAIDALDSFGFGLVALPATQKLAS